MEEDNNTKNAIEGESGTPKELGSSPTPPVPSTSPQSKEHRKSDKQKKPHKHSRSKSYAKQFALEQIKPAESNLKEENFTLFTPRPTKPSKGDEKTKIEFNYFSSEPQYVISEMILRQAVENEITFIDVLHEINKYFRIPLQEKLGKEKEKDIDIIFNDFDLLRATSKEVLTKLTNIAKVGSVFWLSDVYVSSKSYINAHQTFYRGHAAGLTRYIDLREKDPEFKEVLSTCNSSKYRDATLMDLFYYISSRFSYIYDMAYSQFNALKAFNDLGKSIRSSTQLYLEVLRCLPPHQHAQQQARLGKDSMISGMLLAEAQNALARLKEVDSSAASANAIHRVAHLVRSIKRPAGCATIPDAPGRALLGMYDVSLRNKCSFGFSPKVPALLMVFNDGAALCMHLTESNHVRSTSTNSPRIRKRESGSVKVSSISEFKYRLIDWYLPDELWITDLETSDTEIVLRFSKHKGTQKALTSSPQPPMLSPRQSTRNAPPVEEVPVVLPPGWEDIAKGKKHTYSYKPCGISQQTPPESPPSRTSVHDIVFAKGVGEECIKMLARCIGYENCIHKEVHRAPYKMFGSSLESIMAYEQTFNPLETTPHIVCVLTHAVISRGVGEPGLLKSVVEDVKKADELAERINAGQWSTIKWSELEPHTVAALIKKFIRELSDGVIPGDVYDKFLDVAHDESVHQLRKLLNALPKMSYFLLKESLFALSQVASNSHVNNMDAEALAEMAAPSIMVRKDGNFNIKDCERANRVTELMIENYSALFCSPFSSSPSSTTLLAENWGRPESSWVAFCKKLVGHKKSIKVFACLPDERNVLTIDGSGVGILWDTVERIYTRAVDFGADYPAASAFGPDATTIWIGCADSVLVYDIATFALRSTLPIGGFSLLRVGNTIWCGGEGVIHVVAANSPRYNVVAEIKMSAPIIVSSMVEVPTEDAVWVSGHCKGVENSIYVVSKESLAEVISFQAHSQKINGLAICKGNVWSCSDDSTICVWNTRNFRLIEKLTHHSGAVYGLCSLSDQVWSCSWDKTICVWDIDSLRYLGVINGYHTDSVMGMIRIGSKREIWSQSADKSICVWEVKRISK